MNDLVCSWRPRRSLPAAVRDGMRLCVACEEVWVPDELCAPCRQMEMDLENRRMAAESGAGGAGVADQRRPMQPRVQMGLAHAARSAPVGLFAALTVGALAVLAIWCVLGWAL